MHECGWKYINIHAIQSLYYVEYHEDIYERCCRMFNEYVEETMKHINDE